MIETDWKILYVDSIYGDLETYDPRLDRKHFEIWNEWHILITFTIGDDRGGCQYILWVCSKEYAYKHAPMFGRYLLIVDDWDMEDIIYRVNLIIDDCVKRATTDEQVVNNLSKYMFW